MTVIFRERVALVGTPSQPHREWTTATLDQLRRDGFTAVQVNIAWSYRPNDEPLNLEDIIVVEGAPASNADPATSTTTRLEILRRRTELAHSRGLRTLLHVGLPFQGRAGFDGLPLPQCISDSAVADRYESALRSLAREMPGLDDVLIYTYDQDAWLCSEFGTCPRCAGVPLDERLPQFLDRLAAAWRSARTEGRMWWEPWELSAGQALTCLSKLRSPGIGVMVHSNIGEVITVDAGDVFLKNIADLAGQKGIPVIAEVFLSSSNEEVEPWTHLPVPACTLDQLRSLASVPGVMGVKEYFGLQDDPWDVNALATVEYLRDPDATDDDVLARVAHRFDADWLPSFWKMASRAYRLYPWDLSWFARQLGNSHPTHSLQAAILRGTQTAASEWDTPAWRSSRHGVFMRSTADAAHPWELEDARLRFALAASEMQRAVEVVQEKCPESVDAISAHIRRQQADAARFVTRCTAYECHLAETLLAQQARTAADDDRRVDFISQLRLTLQRDLANQKRELALPRPERLMAPLHLQLAERWVTPAATDTSAIEIALALLDSDADSFLETYLQPGPPTAVNGQFSLTSP